MAPDDLIRSLQQIRAEVQALYAMQCMARLELDQCVQSLFGLIDHQVDAAMRVSISNLVETARAMNRDVLDLNRHRGRYFGTVLDLNVFGLLIESRTNAAVIIPLGDIANLEEKPKIGDQIITTYEDGKCQIKIRA